MPSDIVLDTTAFSALIYLRPGIADRYRSEVRSGSRFLLCPVVWYETRRGLTRIRAEGKLRRLDQMTPFFVWNDLTQDDWLLAADTWATLTMQGRSPGDADLLIAVYAARRRAVLVTNNVRHFSVLADPLRLTLQNWPITAQN